MTNIRSNAPGSNGQILDRSDNSSRSFQSSQQSLFIAPLILTLSAYNKTDDGGRLGRSFNYMKNNVPRNCNLITPLSTVYKLDNFELAITLSLRPTRKPFFQINGLSNPDVIKLI